MLFPCNDLTFFDHFRVFLWEAGRAEKDIVYPPRDQPLTGIDLAGAIDREFKNEDQTSRSPLNHLSLGKQKIVRAISKSLKESVGFSSLDDVSENTDHKKKRPVRVKISLPQQSQAQIT